MCNEGICPVCESENIDYDVFSFEGTYGYYPAKCNDCGSTFHAQYNLVFVDNDEIVVGKDYNPSRLKRLQRLIYKKKLREQKAKGEEMVKLYKAEAELRELSDRVKDILAIYAASLPDPVIKEYIAAALRHTPIKLGFINGKSMLVSFVNTVNGIMRLYFDGTDIVYHQDSEPYEQTFWRVDMLHQFIKDFQATEPKFYEIFDRFVLERVDVYEADNEL